MVRLNVPDVTHGCRMLCLILLVWFLTIYGLWCRSGLRVRLLSSSVHYNGYLMNAWW